MSLNNNLAGTTNASSISSTGPRNHVINIDIDRSNRTSTQSPSFIKNNNIKIPLQINASPSSSFAYASSTSLATNSPKALSSSPTISLLNNNNNAINTSNSSGPNSPVNMLFKLNSNLNDNPQQKAKQILVNKLNSTMSSTNNPTGSLNSPNSINSKSSPLSNTDLNNNGGVACQIVKSNTNIYYNLKVDTSASKAIHYCDNCTIPDCKAIHRSLTRPLSSNTNSNNLNNNGDLIDSSQSSLRSRLLNRQTPAGLTRIFLQPTHFPSNNSALSLPSTPNSPSTPNLNNSNNQKLSGANINFIFERRYPLVQLNSNFLNSGGGSGSPDSLRSVSPINQPRQILISRSANNNNNNNNNNPSGTNKEDLGAFPLPISPHIQAVAAAAALAAHAHATQPNIDPNKTFSINFKPTTATALNSLQKDNNITSPTLTNNNNLTNFNFPSMISDLNKLRYRNVNVSLFDQVRIIKN
jgi:hypothetical protein